MNYFNRFNILFGQRRIYCLVAICAFFLLAGSAGTYAAVDMFLKIDGIDGESVDEAHKDEIDILSFDWGVVSSQGRVGAQELTMVHYFDKATPKLMIATLSGQHIPEAILTVRKALGERLLDYIVITMTDVLVTSAFTGGSGGEDLLTEQVTLSFGRIKVSYMEQNPDRPGGGLVEFEWNFEKTGRR